MFNQILRLSVMLALATGGSASAIAQPRTPEPPPADQKTQAPKSPDEIACQPDAIKYCAPLLNQGDLVILGCLQDNRQNLAPQCRKVLEDHGV